MTNKQFYFSLIVGVLMIALGIVLTSQASSGISVMGIGLGISVLTLVSWYKNDEKQKFAWLVIPANRKQHSTLNAINEKG